MQSVQPSSQQLQQLLRDLDSGTIQLPDFQRDFRWKTPQAKALLETIQQNHPAGALMFLKTPDDGSPFGEVPIRYATPAAGKRPEFLVLDGQQRLTSCYLTLFNKGEPHPKRDSSYFIDLLALFEAHLRRTPQGDIDFAPCIKIRPWDPSPNHLLQSEHLLPFALLRQGDANQPREALKTAMLAYRDSVRAERAGTPYFDFIDHSIYEGYLDAFFTYAFPVITLPSGLSISAVCKIFEAINSRGLKLGAFDLAVASLRRQDRNLKQLWELARQNPAVKALDKDGTNLLQTVALLAGKPSKKAELPKTLIAGDLDTHWSAAIDGMNLAGEFIAQFGGGTPAKREFIPYDGIVPVLSAILRRLQDQKLSDIPRANARKIIARWYFTSALGQRYNEGTDVLQERDRNQILPFALGSANLASPDGLEIQGWSPSLWSTSAPSGAIGKAIKCMLNYKGPKDPLSPGILGPGASPTQLHHIFPRGFMRDRPEDAKPVASILNQTFLSPETNRIIGKKAPSQYIPELVTRIAKELGKSESDAMLVLRDCLKEHVIDDDAFDALLSDNFQSFITARARAFAKLFELDFGVQLRDLSNDKAAEEEALAIAEDEPLNDEDADELQEAPSAYDAA